MNYGIPQRVAEEIWLEMRRQGTTLTKLAEVTNIPRQRLGRKLSGKKPLDSNEMEAIVAALGVALSELVRRAEVAA